MLYKALSRKNMHTLLKLSARTSSPRRQWTYVGKGHSYWNHRKFHPLRLEMNLPLVIKISASCKWETAACTDSVIQWLTATPGQEPQHSACDMCTLMQALWYHFQVILLSWSLCDQIHRKIYYSYWEGGTMGMTWLYTSSFQDTRICRTINKDTLP